MVDVIQTVTTIEVEQTTTVIEVIESKTSVEVLRDSNIFFGGEEGGIYYPFFWGDATPINIFTLPAGKILISAILKILTPFDTLSTIEIGIDGDSSFFMPSNANSSQQQGIYSVNPCYRNTLDTGVILKIVPGDNNSTGSGFIFLQLS